MNLVLYELIFPLSIPVNVDFDQAGWLLSQERFRRKADEGSMHVQICFSSFCYISRLLEAMAQYLKLTDVFLERKTSSGENFERLEPSKDSTKSKHFLHPSW